MSRVRNRLVAIEFDRVVVDGGVVGGHAGRHGAIIAKKYWEQGKSCPLAVVNGEDPALFVAGFEYLPAGQSEYEFAGAINRVPAAGEARSNMHVGGRAEKTPLTPRDREEFERMRTEALEVLGDPQSLYPNMPETLAATKTLVAEGFKVMVYCSDDPIQAKLLEGIGCVAVMPLASLIGSGMGAGGRASICPYRV